MRFKLIAMLLLLVPVCILLAWFTSVVDGYWSAFADGWHGLYNAKAFSPEGRAETLGHVFHSAFYLLWFIVGILFLLFCIVNLFMDRE